LFYKHELNAGEQQRTAENRFTKAGRTPFCTAVSAVLSGPYARPCGKPGNLHIPAGFEVP
jgi:hypothetical protein